MAVMGVAVAVAAAVVPFSSSGEDIYYLPSSTRVEKSRLDLPAAPFFLHNTPSIAKPLGDGVN